MTEFETRTKLSRCSSCNFWSPTDPGDGLCRRSHPMGTEFGRALWAVTSASEWCGEYERLDGDSLEARWGHLRSQISPMRRPV
jgi:hypothetical protein